MRQVLIHPGTVPEVPRRTIPLQRVAYQFADPVLKRRPSIL